MFCYQSVHLFLLYQGKLVISTLTSVLAVEGKSTPKLQTYSDGQQGKYLVRGPCDIRAGTLQPGSTFVMSRPGPLEHSSHFPSSQYHVCDAHWREIPDPAYLPVETLYILQKPLNCHFFHKAHATLLYLKWPLSSKLLWHLWSLYMAFLVEYIEPLNCTDSLPGLIRDQNSSYFSAFLCSGL